MARFDARLAADLWFFVNAANSENLDAAASRLAVTQSAVTQRIHRLEQRLGLKLFARQGRNLRLTPEGQRLAETCTSGFDKMQGAIAGLTDTDRSTAVKVSCAPSLAVEWLAPALNDFNALHPDIPIAIFGEMNNVDQRRMTTDNIDIAIRYGTEPPKDALVVAEIPEMVFPVASPRLAHRIESTGQGATVLLHDATPWEGAPSYTSEWDIWLDRRKWPSGDQRQDQFFNMAQLAYRAALGGSGLALGRRLVVSRYLSAGQLVKAGPHPMLDEFRYYICASSPVQLGVVQVFLDWLLEAMQSEGGKPE
ncbi:LysR family transcriptional regulator [Chachezhania sediminis]|uniref:LysR family transcriptional regulator n=1 Tax=Chachezhania sediminis TaxID=2599291 RepID=UPI00131C2D18|nr:LysR family transcriptional regulator [Chachezhania sediminis]